MFSFFKKKFGAPPPTVPSAPQSAEADAPVPLESPVAPAAPAAAAVPVAPEVLATPLAPVAPAAPAASDAPGLTHACGAGNAAHAPDNARPIPDEAALAASPQATTDAPARRSWLERLKQGLKKTGASIAGVFTGAQIDDALYEDLESALLMADTGVKATTHLLQDLRQRVKETRTTDPAAVKGLLAASLTQLLTPLQKPLVIGQFKPTVIMVAGVNGAGKTTSIGKLTRHLAQEGATVLLAAADTFRAAAREQLSVWADRNTVDIISQEGGDPAAVSFDAVSAGKARGRDVVLVDTAGRLPTQTHLMEELKKIKRVIQKTGPLPAADLAGAPAPGGAAAAPDPSAPPHEILLVIDGNTGQNALNQVKAFDDVLGLTGLIVTKLDGTAKGGVLAAIARERPIPVYFIGVGEKLQDLETFNAQEFAHALLN